MCKMLKLQASLKQGFSEFWKKKIISSNVLFKVFDVMGRAVTVIYSRVIDASKAITEVENFLFATSQLAQTTLRSMLGQSELDELLSEREKINRRLQETLDTHTAPWGIKVSLVEVKNVICLLKCSGLLHVKLKQKGNAALKSAAEKNSTTIFPVPIDLFKPLSN